MNRVLVVASLLAAGPLVADQQPLLDDALLEDSLRKHSHQDYSAGIPFPREDLTCGFYQKAVVKRAIQSDSGDPYVFLVSVPTKFASYHLFPNIVHRANGGGWVRTPIPAIHDGWSLVHWSGDHNRFLILMDNVPASPGWETRVVLSSDGGYTWHYGESLRKYAYFDRISFFELNDSGEGTAVEFYDGGTDGYEKAGYHVFRTDDWGLTWSERQYRRTLDTSGLVNVFDGVAGLRDNQTALSEFDLAGLEGCAVK